MADKVKVLLAGIASPDEGSLRAQLDALGYDVQLAATPEDVLTAVETDRPELVLIDATAPDVDGFKVAARVKHITREKALPVMFVCLPRDLRAQVRSRDLGVDDCFAKPIETEALAARIRLLLRNRELELSLRWQNRERELLNQELLSAREALDRELDLASRIQRSLLPETMPELERFQFAAALRSSGPVSGDFYDIYRLDETHYGFYVADAIGHGVPAALLTVFVKKGLQTRDITPNGYELLPPAEVLTRLNRDMMAEKLSSNPFITLFYATLDVASHAVTYASGGHPPAILLDSAGKARPMLSEGALLGIFESDFTTGEVTLEAGDRFVLYSDGIEEARAASGKTGLDALLEHLGASGESDSRESFAERVESSLDLLSNTGRSRRSDDATVFVLRMLR